jgi:hypothetical protein
MSLTVGTYGDLSDWAYGFVGFLRRGMACVVRLPGCQVRLRWSDDGCGVCPDVLAVDFAVAELEYVQQAEGGVACSAFESDQASVVDLAGPDPRIARRVLRWSCVRPS